MRYLNAAQTAKRLNVGDKTIRRWLSAGKYFPGALKKVTGEYAIPENEVEELRIHRASFIEPDETSHVRSTDDIAVLVARIAALEQRCTELERRIDEKSIAMPISSSTTSTTAPIRRAQKRATDENKAVPSELPPGTLAATDFASQIGVTYDHFKNFIRRGVYGQRLDITEIPHPTKKKKDSDEPTMQYFLTPEQQEAACALLRRYGKLPDETSE